jgi:hypothetical protein
MTQSGHWAELALNESAVINPQNRPAALQQFSDYVLKNPREHRADGGPGDRKRMELRSIARSWPPMRNLYTKLRQLPAHQSPTVRADGCRAGLFRFYILFTFHNNLFGFIDLSFRKISICASCRN